MQNNEAALNLDQQQGFSVLRPFTCFSRRRESFPLKKVGLLDGLSIQVVDAFSPALWSLFQSFFDFSPSWQNAAPSLEAVGGQFVYTLARWEGEILGYGLVEKDSGDIPQLAVHKGHRRKGVASALLSALAPHSHAWEIKVINVEGGCGGMEGFLRSQGFHQTAAQYEMLLPLVANG